MSTFKKIIAWTLIILSVIGILACTVGIVGGWVINARLTDRIQILINGVQAITSSVEESLTLASTHLYTANTAINTIRDTASQLGDNASVNTPLLDQIAQTITDALSPAISRIQEVFLPIWERVLTINNTIETLNTIPGVQLPTLSDELQNVNDQIGQMNDAVVEMQTRISDFKAGVIANVLTAFMEKLEPITDPLASLEQKINTSLEKIDQLQTGLANVQAKTASAIDLLTVLVSIWLAWILLGQISLVLAARFYLQSGKMVWENITAETAPGETPLEPS